MPGLEAPIFNNTTPADVQGAAGIPLLFFDTTQAIWIRRTIYYFANSAVLTASILTNAVNVIIFILGGLSDGMSWIFLGLSVSDLLHCLFWLMDRVLGMAQVFFNQHPEVNFLQLNFIISRYARIFYVTSVILTVFAASQKSVCVAFPLTFRFFFTRKRSAICVALIFVSVVISYLPSLTTHRLLPTFSVRFNRTRWRYSARDKALRQSTLDFHNMASFVFLPFISQAIVIFCLLVLIVKLKAAAKTRREMTGGGIEECDPSGEKSADGKNNPTMSEGKQTPGKASATDASDSKAKKDNQENTNFSDKELRVIKSVSLVCGIFIGGTIPYSLINMTRFIFPPFSDGGSYSSLYFLIVSLQGMWYYGSTALNIVVYYKYNTKYKKAFQSHVLCFKEKKK
ncbi:chemosensory receptor c [Plakobranchus ocellatus]|uniref:Chemosensory receptor c n=1 Tax=Plakobranchus ocellatus TaxID=259542 RepID=A0AAV3Z5A9_9GAST|nr:chemosensory receptor c [Plakobranchus ocellatus]